ncbi:FAD binding domain-containing protein [Amycolatopsis jiangsuensis]|uniref:CO/xanthine dehydrogenase FAD-binding subunit n=1 Tax=Amycolatopsis jiangsuensis TaxID=1181879 RepID=A0A840IQM7_9PSEU|nr:FAD binding domain-containing protein [Amycolatopsis jiangsuensis]MBB4683849.1 CO/xanthine dehydrogenase FAD-binding subunit [Amycolatopsis jiangsuensis]
MPVLLFQPQDYQFPSTVEDLLGILDRDGDKARIIAGGTTIHELAYRKGMGDVRTLVDVTRLPWGRIAVEGDVLRIGATATFTELAAHVRATAPRRLAILTDAIAGIRPMQIRNVGTVGGSICSSLPFFDLPAAFAALGASVTTRRLGEQARTTPIEQFFWDFFLPDLRFGEVLTEVDLPVPPPGTGGSFQKFESNSVDWALISIGVQVRIEADRFTEVRIALGGGIGRKVVRAGTAEQALLGRPATAAEISEAARHVTADVRAFSDFRGSAEFRNHLLRTYLTRCLTQATRRAAR